MLAACEEIARRRAASSPLSDRLIATEAMLNDYRAALIAAGAEAFARKRRGGEAPWSLGLSDAEKYAIADATGALLGAARRSVSASDPRLSALPNWHRSSEITPEHIASAVRCR